MTDICDTSRAESGSRKRCIAWMMSFVYLVVCLGLGEIAARTLFRFQLEVGDERNLMYRYDAELGWFPQENSTYTIMGDTIRHNSRGFRDSEHAPDARPGIAVLGDSFVWGYGVDQQAVFTERLRKRLPQANIFNLGVSGYGTDQEFLLLQKHFQYYRPRIVFLVFTSGNDELDNASDMRYGTYYKPYYVIDGSQLKLQGVPVPKSFPYFIRKSGLSSSYLARLLVLIYYRHIRPSPPEHLNPTPEIILSMRDYAYENHALFLVGLQKPLPRLENLCKANQIPYINLDSPEVQYSNVGHWTADGHRIVGDRIADFILSNNFLVH